MVILLLLASYNLRFLPHQVKKIVLYFGDAKLMPF